MTFNNYPKSDYGWDYSKIWYCLQNRKAEPEILPSYIATVEDATQKSDHEIEQQLNEVGQQLNQPRRLLND